MSNFLGQVYVAMGLFEDAEEVLRYSIDLVDDRNNPNPWKGYNQALLGKLYIEWQRIDDAENPMLEGLDRSRSTNSADLHLLVDN